MPKRRKRPNWNLQLHRIYIKGREAMKNGVGEDANPYVKPDPCGGGVKWMGGGLQRQRARSWSQGWRDQAAGEE